MTGKWKTAITALASIGLIWLVSLWRLQSGEGPDVPAAHFFAVPAGMTVLVPLLAWASLVWSARSRPVGAARVAGPRDDALPSTWSPAGPHESPGLHPGVDHCPVILDGEVCLPAGQGALQVHGQVARRAVWPCLDEGLHDVEGNPIYTARLPSPDRGDTAAHSQDLGAGPAPGRVFRARAALLRVWSPLAARFALTLDEVNAGTATLPLQVVLALPRSWTESQRQQTLLLLQRQARAVGEASLPAALRCEWQLLPPQVLEEPEGLWRWMGETLGSWAAQRSAASLLILAADSDLDEEAVAQRQDRGELFTAIHQQGRIPGEGAAALWLATRSWMDAAGLGDRAAVQLHPPVLACRDKSADAVGPVDHGVLAASLDQAITRLKGRPVLSVVSDADHRASRTTELLSSLAQAVPHLDRQTEVCRLGDACGDLGVAGALAPVAVAAGLLRDQLAGVTEGREPGVQELPPRAVLAVCVQSPRRRVVVPLSTSPARAA